MKKEWLSQLIILLIFYMDSIIHVEHRAIHISPTPGIDFLFLLYHATLFFAVNYVLIPKLLYPKRYALFFTALIALIISYGIVEEVWIEQWLTPDTRGVNPLTWQSIYWFFGEILVPLLAFMTTKLLFDNFDKQQALEQIEKDNLTNELKLLKSQIQPHILFNSLNNLYNFALAKSDKAPELILKLANVLRYILYEATTEKVALSKELAFVEDYIDLQRVQFEGRGVIDYALKQENASQAQTLSIAPFILIPFIENSFKHSFGTKIKDVEIDIQVNVEGKQLELLVRNNFEKKQNETEALIYSGIGLKNVQKRLDLLYPNQYDLSITNTDENYQVSLNLKLA